jgi:hypothetical protein
MKVQLQIKMCRTPKTRFDPTDKKRPTDINLSVGRFSSVGKIFCTKLVLPAIFVALLILPIKPLLAQNGTTVDQKMIRVATIADPKLIEFFLFEFLITDTAVTKMEIIDATGNGFGVEDLVKCYPSERIYVPTPSDTAQKVMNNWKFTANYQIVTQNSPPEVFEGTKADAAQNAILAALLRGLQRNYKESPIKLYFERDAKTATFEMWGYSPSRLSYAPAPPPMPDTVTAYDVLSVTYQDTFVVADTTIYDLLYISRTVSDTVFVGLDEFDSKEPLNLPPPETQPKAKSENRPEIWRKP